MNPSCARKPPSQYVNPLDSRPCHRALGHLPSPVQVARVLLDQDAGHVLLEADARPRTQAVRLIQSSLGLTHLRGADEDENQSDVQAGQVAVPARVDGRRDAVADMLLGRLVVPGRIETLEPTPIPRRPGRAPSRRPAVDLAQRLLGIAQPPEPLDTLLLVQRRELKIETLDRGRLGDRHLRQPQRKPAVTFHAVMLARASAGSQRGPRCPPVPAGTLARRASRAPRKSSASRARRTRPGPAAPGQRPAPPPCPALPAPPGHRRRRCRYPRRGASDGSRRWYPHRTAWPVRLLPATRLPVA